jgi:hypothetical protein
MQFPKTLCSIVRVTSQLAVYCQSVHLVAKPLEAHDQRLHFSTELLQSQSLCNILSDENMGLSFMNMLGLCLVKYRMILKILPFIINEIPLSVEALSSRSCLYYLAYSTTAA